MPVKHDATSRRWVEVETVLPGTAEQVWRAVATGVGLSAWFVPTTLEERDGGALQFDFGDGAIGHGTVTAWEPPFRFGYEERDWDKDAPPVHTECLVSPRGEGACLFRMTHTVCTSDDRWDQALEGFESGWMGFFAVLRLYLARYAGQPAAMVRASAMLDADAASAWTTLVGALALADAHAGTRCTAPAGAPAFAGSVERIAQDRQSREMLLHLDVPGPGVAWIGSYPVGERTRVGLQLIVYGQDAANVAAAEQPRWDAWLAGQFPAAAQGSAGSPA